MGGYGRVASAVAILRTLCRVFLILLIATHEAQVGLHLRVTTWSRNLHC